MFQHCFRGVFAEWIVPVYTLRNLLTICWGISSVLTPFSCAVRMIEMAFFCEYFLTSVSVRYPSVKIKNSNLYNSLVKVCKTWLECWKTQNSVRRVWLFVVVPSNWLSDCGLFFNIMKALELIFNFIIIISLQLLLKHQYQLLESAQIWWHTQLRQSLTTLSRKKWLLLDPFS